MRKLTDAELAGRVRTRNSKRITAYRDRLLKSGLTQFNVWIPADLRQQIDVAAAANSRTLSAETSELIREGFDYRELAK